MSLLDVQASVVAAELQTGLDAVHQYLYSVALALEYVPPGEIKDGLEALQANLDAWHLRIENAVAVFNAVEADRQRLIAEAS